MKYCKERQKVIFYRLSLRKINLGYVSHLPFMIFQAYFGGKIGVTTMLASKGLRPQIILSVSQQ